MVVHHDGLAFVSSFVSLEWWIARQGWGGAIVRIASVASLGQVPGTEILPSHLSLPIDIWFLLFWLSGGHSQPALLTFIVYFVFFLELKPKLPVVG